MEQAGEASAPPANRPPAAGPGPARQAVARGCTGCGACVKPCGFLRGAGDPGQVARTWDPGRPAERELPFTCSLCGLCTALCPEGLDPGQMFLELRREVTRRWGRFSRHEGLRAYERRGTSHLYSYYALPAGCDTVWFPGCALAGAHPQRALDLHRHLSTAVPGLGVVLDCCTKPSHDLGQERYFQSMFGELREYLLSQGVRRVLVACPNCHKVFQGHGGELETRTVYQVLDEVGLPGHGVAPGTVVVHDPCVARFEPGVQAAARSLLAKAGLAVEEMRNSGARTLCCGEGGAVACLSPELARSWGTRRGKQAGGRAIATYCAGCVRQLARHAPTRHLLDLLWAPESNGGARPARPPFTYWNRLRLKSRLRREVAAAVTRERTFCPDGPTPLLRRLRPLALLERLMAAIANAF